MGALTSKPFSFTARSWELTDRITCDFNDTFFSSIKVSFRGNSIIRILPDFTSDSLSEWIGDRIRFSYDMVSDSSTSRDLVSTFKTNFSAFWITFFSKRFNVSDFFNQSHFDLSTIYRLKNINFFTGSIISSYGLYDFRKFFYSNFNNLSKLISSYKFFYFIGINLRYMLPVLAVSFRRLVSVNDVVIFNLGFFTNNLLSDVNLGSSTNTLIEFFRNSSRLNRFFVSNKELSCIFSLPHFSTYVLMYTRNYIHPDQIHFFFSRPFALSSAEISYSPVFSNSKFLKFYFPHPFNYVTYQIKGLVYQKVDSLFSNFFYGNTVKLFDKVVSERFEYCLPSFNNFSYFTFSNNNFYNHFFTSIFNRSSLNILISLRRQQDLRSSFQYYN